MMHNLRLMIGAALIFVACADRPAAAQNAMVLDRIRQLDAAAPAPDPEALAPILLDAANRVASKGCSPTAIRVERIAPITGDRFVLGAVLNGRIRNGWTVYGREEGCPDADPVRFMVLQHASNQFVTTVVNRGRSNTSPSIMIDTSANVALAVLHKVKTVNPACTGEGTQMVRTRLDREDADLGPELFGIRYKGSWREIWTFGLCGRLVEVPVTFTGDGDGGAYNKVEASAAVLLPAK